MRNPPLGIVPPFGYVLNDAPGSPVSPPRGPTVIDSNAVTNAASTLLCRI